MKTSEDFEREFIQACEEKTGRSLEAWMKLLKETSLSKQKEITDYLKNDHGVSHMNAGFIAGIFLNNGKVYELFSEGVTSSGLWGFIVPGDELHGPRRYVDVDRSKEVIAQRDV